MESKVITAESIGAKFLTGTNRVGIYDTTTIPPYCFADIGRKVYFNFDKEGICAAKILGFMFAENKGNGINCTHIKVLKPNGEKCFIYSWCRCFPTKDDCMAYIMGDISRGIKFEDYKKGNILLKDVAKDLIIDSELSSYLIGHTYYYNYKHINSVPRLPIAIYINSDGVYFVKASIKDEMAKYYTEGCRLYETKEECFKDNAPKTVMDFADDEPTQDEIKFVEPTTNNTTYIIFKRD